MQRQFFDRNLLLSVLKPVPNPIPLAGAQPRQPDQFALAIVRPGEDTSGLLAAVYTLNPAARILELSAPPGKDNLKQYRALLSDLLHACDEPPLRHGQESAISARLPRLLTAHFDYLVIHHAENLGTYALDALRRDRGNPPVILIAYTDRVLNTLLSQDALMRRVVLLT